MFISFSFSSSFLSFAEFSFGESSRSYPRLQTISSSIFSFSFYSHTFVFLFLIIHLLIHIISVSSLLSFSNSFLNLFSFWISSCVSSGTNPYASSCKHTFAQRLFPNLYIFSFTFSYYFLFIRWFPASKGRDLDDSVIALVLFHLSFLFLTFPSFISFIIPILFLSFYNLLLNSFFMDLGFY